ncbi:Autophagy-related protein 14 [Nakaseomyces bracarensis]|uniref:Autophagy-related protein 14 n=1 Tax=Nakaseomyces bracarensis TaxID=273131 RepID=A0ABR4NU02_9SACH
MQCPVCDTQSHVFLCSHCVNSSPDLLVSLKLDLIILNETNEELKRRINTIMDHQGKVQTTAGKNGSVNGIEVLEERLRRMDVLRSTRLNNKIKYRIEQQNIRLNKKREEIERLKTVLVSSRTRVHDTSIEKKLHEKTNELKSKLSLTSKLVEQTQSDKVLALNRWYSLRKRESFEIPYTIAYQPVLSLKNYHKFPMSIIEGSLIKMVQYMNIFTSINFIQIPTIFIVNEVDISTKHEEVLKLKRKSPIIVTALAKCVVQIMLIMTRHLRLLNDDDQNVDFEWILDQYDIDGLFYHMATGAAIDAKKSRVASTLTLERALEIICSSLKVDKSDIMLYPGEKHRAQLLDNHTKQKHPHTEVPTDRWYIVG